MADGRHVFISYCSADRAQALALKARLESEGHSVWIDQKWLVAGEAYHKDIAAAITDAYAAVVIWSREAAQSLWVYAEAQRAKGQRKIVPVRIEPVTGDKLVIPLPFDALHTIRYERIDDIVAAIEKRRRNLPLEPAENRSVDDIARDIIDPRYLPLPEDAVDTSPTTLLQARHCLVPFDDETGAMAELLGWATGKPAWARGRIALARLIHGPGGLGKTRLLVEAAKKLFDRGWIAGFVPHEVFRERARFDELRRILRHRIDCNGVLIAVDYVEALRKEDIARLAETVLEAAAVPGPPIRLVLLARAAGGWWQSLVNADASLQRLTARDGGPDTIGLQPMGRGRADRVALFDAAWQVFNAEIAAFERRHDCRLRKDGGVDFTEIERLLQKPDDPTFERPLFIHIAALLAAYGDADTAIARGVPGLLDGILGLEHGRWDRAMALDLQTNRREAIHRAAAQVTAMGKLASAAEVDVLVAADPFYGKVSDTDPVQTARDVCRLLPGQGAEVEGLQPDLVGEHHVLDRMTVELLKACLAWAGGEEARRVALLTVLQRATRAEHGDKAERAVALIDQLIRQHAAALAPALMRVMETTPGQARDRVGVLLDTLPAETVSALSFALPEFNVGWLEFSVRVTARHVDVMREAAVAIGAIDARSSSDGLIEALGHYSTALNNHAIRLGEDGRREDALAATEEAVRLRRALAAARPDAFTPDLAASLNNLGIRYDALGRREDALAATEEAVRLRRALAAARPDAFTPDLAASLNNLGAMLDALGRREDALAATEEAVRHYRALAAARPDAFTPNLARSLSVLSDIHSAIGHHAAAAAAAHEALQVLLPHLEQLPRAHAGLAAAICKDIQAKAEKAGVEPDMVLLERALSAIMSVTPAETGGGIT